jgi:hypothetical protein
MSIGKEKLNAVWQEVTSLQTEEEVTAINWRKCLNKIPEIC